MIRGLLAAVVLVLTEVTVAICADTGTAEQSKQALSLVEKAKIADREGDTGSGIDLLEKACLLNPENEEALMILAELYQKDQQINNAILCLRSLLAKTPSDTNAQKLLSLLIKQRQVHLERGRPELSDGIYWQRSHPRARAFGAKVMVTNDNVEWLLKNQVGIAYSRDGDLYKTDCENDRIFILKGKGRRIDYFEGPELSGPKDLDFDEAGNLFVTNYLSGEIVMISPAGSTMVIADSLDKPVNIFFAGNGTIYVKEEISVYPIKIILPENFQSLDCRNFLHIH